MARAAPLSQVWEAGAGVAQRNLGIRADDVLGLVARRFREIGRSDKAGHYYEMGRKPREAIDCYVAANMWDRAQACAAWISGTAPDPPQSTRIRWTASACLAAARTALS